MEIGDRPCPDAPGNMGEHSQSGQQEHICYILTLSLGWHGFTLLLDWPLKYTQGCCSDLHVLSIYLLSNKA